MAVRTKGNTLYPVFLKIEQLTVVLVGAGDVAHEKLSFLLKSSPKSRVRIVAKEIMPPVLSMLENYSGQLAVVQKAFEPEDLDGADIVIAATNLPEINIQVHAAAKNRRVLVNVADTPELCDFYMGSIVTRGDLKVAISTNGKSPTFAKRFRQLLEEIIPEETHDLLSNLRVLRDRMKGNFEVKVRELNRITESLIG